MTTTIVFVITITLLIIGIILASSKVTRFSKSNTVFPTKVLLSNGGVHTDDREIPKFVASGFMNEGKNF